MCVWVSALPCVHPPRFILLSLHISLHTCHVSFPFAGAGTCTRLAPALRARAEQICLFLGRARRGTPEGKLTLLLLFHAPEVVLVEVVLGLFRCFKGLGFASCFEFGCWLLCFLCFLGDGHVHVDKTVPCLFWPPMVAIFASCSSIC